MRRHHDDELEDRPNPTTTLEARDGAVPEEDEEGLGSEARAATWMGNRGFATLAREGEGILPGGRVHPDVERAIAGARGGGRPLDAAGRALVAPRRRHEVGDVRVHDGPEAARLARAVDARAFTVGSDVFLGEGEQRPGTPEGDSLMAHELTHVVQARRTPATGPLRVSNPGDRAEREADAAPARPLQRAPRGKPASTISFGTGEADVVEGSVHRLGVSAGTSAEKEIEDHVKRLGSELQMTEKNILTALDQFSDDQSFSSSAEGEADFSGVFLTFAIKTILGLATGHLGKEGGALPGVDKVHEIVFGLQEVLAAEEERAAKARGSRAVASFLGTYRGRVTEEFDKRIRGLDGMKDGLIEQYRTLAAASPALSTPKAPAPGSGSTAPAVAGEAARLLSGLKAQVDSVRAPSFADCLQTIVEAWVMQVEGQLRSRGGGDIYRDGRILVAMKIMKVGDSYRVVEKPKGRLQAPRADHVIDSLRPVFDKGKTTSDLGILKSVTITVEDEIDWDFNDWYETKLSFRRRGEFEDAPSTIGHPVREERVHRRAPEIQRRVLQMVTFEDLALTELSPAPEGR
jgi:hypothetical protein